MEKAFIIKDTSVKDVVTVTAWRLNMVTKSSDNARLGFRGWIDSLVIDH